MSSCHPPTSGHQMISPHPHPWRSLTFPVSQLMASRSPTERQNFFDQDALSRPGRPPGCGSGALARVPPGWAAAALLVSVLSGALGRFPANRANRARTGTHTGHTACAFDVLAERAARILKGRGCRGGEHVGGLGSVFTASHVLHLMHAPGAAPA